MLRAGSRSPSDERGASLVEAALITPVFLLLVFTIFEFGLLALSDLATTNASRDGARAASVFDSRRNADYEILQTVRDRLGMAGLQDLEYVVVYRIDQVGDEMNPTCRTQSVSAATDPTRPCNRYLASDMELPYYEGDGVTETSHFGCGTGAVDRFWCPGTRKTSLAEPLDLVGVHVETTHTYLTGFIGSTRGLSEDTVIQIEPKED